MSCASNFFLFRNINSHNGKDVDWKYVFYGLVEFICPSQIELIMHVIDLLYLVTSVIANDCCYLIVSSKQQSIMLAIDIG